MINNDYDAIAGKYECTNEKPDKKYSTLPTILKLAGGVRGKTVVVLGCGNGFFSRAFVTAGAARVVGVDNSPAYHGCVHADIFNDTLPSGDIVLAPYVINYATSNEELRKLFFSIYASLNVGGKFIGTIDEPAGHDTKKFGALKFLHGTNMDIQLYKDENLICKLSARYFSRDEIERALHIAGFDTVIWYEPVISEEGIKKFGPEFWRGYEGVCELGYFVADK